MNKGVVKRAIVTPDKHFPIADMKAINVVCKYWVNKSNRWVLVRSSQKFVYFETLMS